jgi:SAM-dependent methyltransferase
MMDRGATRAARVCTLSGGRLPAESPGRRLPVRVNLGCGRKYLDGYINCDVITSVRSDRCFDLNVTPYPFEADSVDEILADNVLEHLEDVVRTMEEIHRILRPGGTATILLPYSKSDGALHDPTHRHFFTERSMDYFALEHPYNFYSSARFIIRKARLVANNHTTRLRLRNLIPFKGILRYFFYNMYDIIHFELQKPILRDSPAVTSR